MAKSTEPPPRTRDAEAAYTLREAAAIKRVSPTLLRKAIHATEGPTLRAKRVSNGYRVTASELDRWFDSLDDA